MSVAAIATSSAGLTTKDPHRLEALKQRRCPVYEADLQYLTRRTKRRHDFANKVRPAMAG